MKQLIYSLVLVIAIIFVGIFTIKMLNKDAESLHTLLVEIEDNVYSDDWSMAQKIIKETKKEWDKYKKVWPMLIDHLEIDNVNTKLAELQAYISSNNKTETLSRLAALKVLIKHIPERESFIIQNIF